MRSIVDLLEQRPGLARPAQLLKGRRLVLTRLKGSDRPARHPDRLSPPLPTLFPHLQVGSDPDPCSWTQFLKRADPQHTADSWSSELLGPLAEVEARRWEKLAGALEKLTSNAAAAGLPLPEPLEAWAEWVVPVGRLSFETGRSVTTL